MEKYKGQCHLDSVYTNKQECVILVSIGGCEYERIAEQTRFN